MLIAIHLATYCKITVMLIAREELSGTFKSGKRKNQQIHVQVFIYRNNMTMVQETLKEQMRAL